MNRAGIIDPFVHNDWVKIDSTQCYGSGTVRIPIIPGVGSIHSVSDLGHTLMITTKLTGTENVTTYACYLAPGGPTDKEIKLRCITSTGTVLGTLPLRKKSGSGSISNSRIRIKVKSRIRFLSK